MDSIIAWAVLTLLSLWGIAWLFLQIINENESRIRRSEDEWRRWEREMWEHETI